MKTNFHFALFLSLGIIFSGKASAQAWSDYIFEEKGDTVVVRGSTNMLAPYADALNTIAHAVLGDTLANGDRTNPNRVYETMPGETYISDATLELDSTVLNLVITAPLPEDGQTPPIHIRAKKPNGMKDKTYIQSVGNIYVENQYYCGVFTDDTYESEFSRAASVGSRVIINNCIFDMTRWVICIPLAKYVTYKFTNCKFINIGHEATLEKGIVVETREYPPDTIWFENNTCINSGGFILSLYNSAPTFAYFNHNTIVNCAQGPFMFHSAGEVIVENNLIVNAGIIPDYPGFYTLFDDDDHLPKGIINVDTVELEWKNNYWDALYPFAEADRKILVDRNNVWWDPRFEAMLADSMPPIYPDSMDLTWASQMIWMNDRTKSMFDDNAAYPYYTEGSLLNIEPDFNNNKDLVYEWIKFIVSNTRPGAPSTGLQMPHWRTNDVLELYKIDWPMLADLSYSNAMLKSGGLNHFPMGDLNWFPDEKEEWESTNESEILIAAMKSKIICDDCHPNSIPNKSEELNTHIEVFPNPISDLATLRFDINRPSNMELIVYNILGEKVHTINIGYCSAGLHEVPLLLRNLKPGMYMIQLNMEDDNAGLISKIIIQ